MENIILKSMLLLWAVSAVLSCNNLLEEKVYDSISPKQLGDSENAKSQLLTGTYNTTISSSTTPSSHLYLTNIGCDYASSASWAFGNVGARDVSGFWGKDHLWQGCYTLIHRANLAVSKISAMSNISRESETDAIGQLSFLKAWAYFNLVRSYGGVPIFRKSISEGEDMNQPRTLVPDVHTRITELLKIGEGMYSKNNSVLIEGHTSGGAAEALSAEVHATTASDALSGAPVAMKEGAPNLPEP